MTPSSPWAWASADSSERLWADIRRDGHTLFTDPHALSRSGDPVAFAQHLFGLRPVRYQRMLQNEFQRMHQEYDFQELNGNLRIENLQRQLRTKIGAMLGIGAGDLTAATEPDAAV